MNIEDQKLIDWALVISEGITKPLAELEYNLRLRQLGFVCTTRYKDAPGKGSFTNNSVEFELISARSITFSPFRHSADCSKASFL